MMTGGGAGPLLLSLAVAEPATGRPRAAAYISGFLARLLLDTPSEEIRSILGRTVDPPLGDGLDARVEEVARLYREADEIELAREWMRLFVGPRGAPCRPWHDSWECDGPPQLMGPKHESMVAFYRRAGLEPIHAESQPADHIGFVLALFAALAARAAEGEQILLADIDALWKAHVAPWIPRFAETLVAEARVPALEAAGRLLLDGVS